MDRGTTMNNKKEELKDKELSDVNGGFKVVAEVPVIEEDDSWVEVLWKGLLKMIAK